MTGSFGPLAHWHRQAIEAANRSRQSEFYFCDQLVVAAAATVLKRERVDLIPFSLVDHPASSNVARFACSNKTHCLRRTAVSRWSPVVRRSRIWLEKFGSRSLARKSGSRTKHRFQTDKIRFTKSLCVFLAFLFQKLFTHLLIRSTLRAAAAAANRQLRELGLRFLAQRERERAHHRSSLTQQSNSID